MAQSINFWTLLRLTQEYISEHYAAALTDPEKLPQLKAYIEQYIRKNGDIVDGCSLHELTDRLYREMAEYSILTPFLGSEELEEINSATRS